MNRPKLQLNRETLLRLQTVELETVQGAGFLSLFGCKKKPDPKPQPHPRPQQPPIGKIQSFGFCTGPIHNPGPISPPRPQTFGFCVL